MRDKEDETRMTEKLGPRCYDGVCLTNNNKPKIPTISILLLACPSYQHTCVCCLWGGLSFVASRSRIQRLRLLNQKAKSPCLIIFRRELEQSSFVLSPCRVPTIRAWVPLPCKLLITPTSCSGWRRYQRMYAFLYPHLLLLLLLTILKSQIMAFALDGE